jgi:hypothetical protein
LKYVAEINNKIKDFIDLKNYINIISSVESYIELEIEFKNFNNYFRNYPFSHEMKKAMINLRSRIHNINKGYEKKIEQDTINKIHTLEKNSPKCPRGHQMVIRQGEYGYFWGCSSFPNCHHIKNLRMKEEDSLYY